MAIWQKTSPSERPTFDRRLQIIASPLCPHDKHSAPLQVALFGCQPPCAMSSCFLLIPLFQLATRCRVRIVPRESFPKSLREFQKKFASEEACQAYLASCRWPDGFVCPGCGGHRANELLKLRCWQCVSCRHQVSLTAGTVLHNTRTPLSAWFWAAYLMTTDKRDFRSTLAASTGAVPLRDCLDDAPQIPAGHGECNTGAAVG